MRPLADARVGQQQCRGRLVATLASTAVQAKARSATVGGASLSGAAAVTAGPPAAATSTVSASPAAVVVAGAAAVMIPVRLRDAQAKPVPSQALTLAAGRSGNRLVASSGRTSAAGAFRTIVTPILVAVWVGVGIAGMCVGVVGLIGTAVIGRLPRPHTVSAGWYGRLQRGADALLP